MRALAPRRPAHTVPLALAVSTGLSLLLAPPLRVQGAAAPTDFAQAQALDTGGGGGLARWQRQQAAGEAGIQAGLSSHWETQMLP
jgi:hypothetical protein